jgi:hypothetical protein
LILRRAWGGAIIAMPFGPAILMHARLSWCVFIGKISLHTNNLAVPSPCQGKGSGLRPMIQEAAQMLEKQAC